MDFNHGEEKKEEDKTEEKVDASNAWGLIGKALKFGKKEIPSKENFSTKMLGSGEAKNQIKNFIGGENIPSQEKMKVAFGLSVNKNKKKG